MKEKYKRARNHIFNLWTISGRSAVNILSNSRRKVCSGSGRISVPQGCSPDREEKWFILLCKVIGILHCVQDDTDKAAFFL
jgi:RNase P subunit RPR2